MATQSAALSRTELAPQTDASADADAEENTLAAFAALTAATAAPPEATTANRRECREIAPPREGTRLFLVNPFPVRLALLIGTGADSGLLLVIEAPECWDRFSDGHYSWPAVQQLFGFQFRTMTISTLMPDGYDVDYIRGLPT